MKAQNVKQVEGIKLSDLTYKNTKREIKGVTLRWLSKSGEDSSGQPEYGLRHFTVEPGGFIPSHNHFYLQTVYVESGSFECCSHHPETDEVVSSKICSAGDFVYSESMEPHSMRNVSETEPATFLCCICNLY